MTKYYRFYTEKPASQHGIYETAKAIGFEIYQKTWTYHENNVRIAWFAKSQIIIEETADQIDYYIPMWMLNKSHLTYDSFEGVGTYFGKNNYIVER